MEVGNLNDAENWESRLIQGIVRFTHQKNTLILLRFENVNKTF